MNSIITVHNNEDYFKYLHDEISAAGYIIIDTGEIKNIPNILRTKNVNCIVFSQNILNDSTGPLIKNLKSTFPKTWIVTLMFHTDIETARQYGVWGIDKILIPDNESTCISIIELSKTNVRILLSDIGVDKNKANYSVLLKRALYIIEQDYILLTKVQTIAEMLMVVESTLIREFQRYELASPKKLLMVLKVRHAIRLMHNHGLNINEVAHLSGFTSVKRMTECFQRTYRLPPGKFKTMYLTDDSTNNKINQILSEN